MRKLLFIIALISSMNCRAQQVLLDKQENNGDRAIVTTSVIFTKDKGFLGSGASHEIFMQLNRFRRGNVYVDEYSICFPQISTRRWSLDVGRRMLLKTQKDSAIEIANTIPVSESDNTYEIISNYTFYTIHPLYGVSSEQINQIIKGGIKKLRIETNSGAYDLAPNDKSKFWNFSLAVKMCYDCIQKRLSYNNDIHNNF